MKARYVILSVLLHAFLFMFTFSGGHQGNGNEGGDDKKKESSGGGSLFEGVISGKVKEKERPTEVEIVEYSDSEGIKKKKQEKADEDCKGSHYEGIGIQSWVEPGVGEVVQTVYKGYPADLADVRVRDVIVACSDAFIWGPKGTKVTLTLRRDGVILVKTITRGKICY